MLLTPAFRSLSRPSSPYSSQASAIDLYSLDHIVSSASFPSFHLPQFQGILFKLPLLPTRQETGFPSSSLHFLSKIHPLYSSFLRHFKKLFLEQSFNSSRKETIDFLLYCYMPFVPYTLYFSFLFLKGGDPAAPSGTTTLLRLHPPHEAYLRQRPPCG